MLEAEIAKLVAKLLTFCIFIVSRFSRLFPLLSSSKSTEGKELLVHYDSGYSIQIVAASAVSGVEDGMEILPCRLRCVAGAVR
jgi:hypothetical protein